MIQFFSFYSTNKTIEIILNIIDSYIRGTKNYVGEDDHLIEQVRTNNNGALNLLLGQPLEINTDYLILKNGNNKGIIIYNICLNP